MTFQQIGFILTSPPYHFRDVAKDICSSKNPYPQQAEIAEAILTLLLLNKYFERLFSILMSGIRVLNCESLDKKTAAVAITCIGTIVSPQLGMLLTAGQDFIENASACCSALLRSNPKEVLKSLILATRDGFYLILFFKVSVELILISLSIQIISALFVCREKFQKKDYVGVTAHLIVAIVRGLQLKKQIEILQKKLEFKTVLAENRPDVKKQYKINDFNFPETIVGDKVTLCRVTEGSEHSKFLSDMEEFYFSQEIIDQVAKTTACWCICDERKKPLGFILIDPSFSLRELYGVIPDRALAAELFARNKFLELQYSLKEEYQNCGFGSKAVKALHDYALKAGWSDLLFARIHEGNRISGHLLKKHLWHFGGIYGDGNETFNIYTASSAIAPLQA